MVRALHRLIWVRHMLALYVDDLFSLLEENTAPTQALLAIFLCVALGIPLSWHKLQLGNELQWIGWCFRINKWCAELPCDKKQKLLVLLLPLTRAKQKIDKRQLERFIGLAIWFTAGALWLRPWLQAFYNLLYKPRAVPMKLDHFQFRELLSVLGVDFCLNRRPASFYAEAGWKLHKVGNQEVTTMSASLLSHACMTNGHADVVLLDLRSQSARVSKEVATTAIFFYNTVEAHVSVPLRLVEGDSSPAAADAFAESDRAGIGGWWLPPGVPPCPENILWFSMPLERSDLPPWF